MSDVFKGVAAGLVATGFLAGILIVQRALGLFPELDPIRLTSIVAGVPGDRIVGWIVYISVGAVAGGILFAWLEPRLGADKAVKRGLLFGVLAWLAKMVFLMPAANAGLFGLRLGPAAPILMLMMDVAYGAALGWLYGSLMPTPSLESRDSHHRAA